MTIGRLPLSDCYLAGLRAHLGAKRSDNGNRAQRLGLIGMKERVEMVGSKLVIESVPGQSTAVRVDIFFN